MAGVAAGVGEGAGFRRTPLSTSGVAEGTGAGATAAATGVRRMHWIGLGRLNSPQFHSALPNP